jgi:hypothetical protein
MSSEEGAEWIRAGTPGGSVELRRVADTVEIREGGGGAVLRFTLAEWAAWLDGAKAGEFDHLTRRS